MSKKPEKTNAARLLDKAKIWYNLIPYEFDENDLAAWHVADSLGQDISRVFKTLVLHISAGVRGLQFEISPDDLISFVTATVADVATDDSQI